MESLFFLAGVALVLAVPAGLVFWLGYNTARSQNAKHHKTIQRSYGLLIEEQKKTATTPSGEARLAGYREGYRQALDDLHVNTRKVLDQYET
jgi:hypothetical protein